MNINSRRVRAQPALTVCAEVKARGIPPEIFSAVSPTECEGWVYSEVVSIPWRKIKPFLMKFSLFSYPFPTPTTFPLKVLPCDPILPSSLKSIQSMGITLIYSVQQEMLVENSSKCRTEDPETSGIKIWIASLDKETQTAEALARGGEYTANVRGNLLISATPL